MSPEIKRQLISIGQTFVGSFLAFVVPSLLDPSWTYTGKAAIVSLLVAGARSAVKITWEKWGPKL